MNASQAIQSALSSTQHILNWYVSDLSDADLLVRPASGANHIAWQLGHVIVGEKMLVDGQLPGATYPELPAGFAEKYDTKAASQENPKDFPGKANYVELFNKLRDVTKAAVTKLSDADFDRPVTGDMAKFTPTLGELLLLVANHTLMHAGQFTVVRRKLGKPVLF